MTENKGLVESNVTLKKKKGLSKLLITAGSIDSRTDSAVYHFNNRDRVNEQIIYNLTVPSAGKAVHCFTTSLHGDLHILRFNGP